MKLTLDRIQEIEHTVEDIIFKVWEVAQIEDFLNVIEYYGNNNDHVIEASREIRAFIAAVKDRRPYDSTGRAVIEELIGHIRSQKGAET